MNLVRSSSILCSGSQVSLLKAYFSSSSTCPAVASDHKGSRVPFYIANRNSPEQIKSSYWDISARKEQNIRRRLERQQEVLGRINLEKKKHMEQKMKKKDPRAVRKPLLRGHPKDEEEVRLSKTLTWILRHGAKSEGIHMRDDGYVRITDLLKLPRFRSVDFETIERIVKHDMKMRYHLLFEPQSEGSSVSEDIWWIRANQGHSLKGVDLQLSEITDAGQVPMVVHGTYYKAWSQIEKQGLSPMTRHHIHLSQGLPSEQAVKSGMRSSSQVFIYIDLDKALRAGIKFYLSENGVILTKGDDTGFLKPEYFLRVTNKYGKPLPGWDNGNMQQSKANLDNHQSEQLNNADTSEVHLEEQASSNFPKNSHQPSVDEVTEQLGSVSVTPSS